MKRSFHKLVSDQKRKIAAALLTVMVAELVLPVRALALSSGPSQPEFQGFAPLATTSLVEPFSGDFSYNIPLLEIDGYPLNLVYRSTSNIEEEGSWVGYGWNVNVGTLNRLVRGLPDDMNGAQIKTFQNVRERTVFTTSVEMEPSMGVHVGSDNIGLTAGMKNTMGFSYSDDNYIGVGVGLSVGAGVYANVNAGPFTVGASAGVTTSAHSNQGGSISTYAGWNVGFAYGEYLSIGYGKSRSRTFNTISGWEKPQVVGTLSLSNITREIQKSHISSISNEVPIVTMPYKYSCDGIGYRLDMNFSLGIIEQLGIDMGMAINVSYTEANTSYDTMSVHKGFGYMYTENAQRADMLDFTRDNDGGINKYMPYLPPAMKTYDVFSSTAHNASNTFRADRNDFGTVRDPDLDFWNTWQRHEMHELEVDGFFSLTCIGAAIYYNNVRTKTDGHVKIGGCPDNMLPHRPSRGKDQNLFFKASGTPSIADDNYLSQVKGYGYYSWNANDTVKGVTVPKKRITPEPIAVFTNQQIGELPQTVVTKKLFSYAKNDFPVNTAAKDSFIRAGSADDIEKSKIGAIFNTNRAGQTYVYATPAANHIKSEVAFRVDGFNTSNYQESEGLMTFDGSDASKYNGNVRDKLYKSKFTPSYAHSYMLNAVLSPDYVDVLNDGISDDDLGSYVKFNYTKAENDYRWRVPYADSNENLAFLNEGIKVTKFDNQASYMIGSKELWYAHSMESKNYVVEFYLSQRDDALDSRSRIMNPDHLYAVAGYDVDKDTFARMQKLDSIKYYYKHDRYINQSSAVPLKTIYFSYDYGISSGVPNSVNNGGKLRLLKVRVKHGSEPIEFAETYDFGYSSFNPAYSIGTKDGWGNYCPNPSSRPFPLCEFPYIDQVNRTNKDAVASAFHMNSIGLPSGGKIEVEYEADDYAWVQNKRAMALTQVVGVGPSQNVILSDVQGLYDGGLNPYRYIYIAKPPGLGGGNVKSFLLNGSDLMYFNFNINMCGNAFDKFDQVKGYAVVEDAGICANDGNYVWLRVQKVDLTGTNVDVSPMTNTAINMARAFTSDQLYFQEPENSNGRQKKQVKRLIKAAVMVADAIFGKNSIKELMKDYRAGHKFRRDKSFVRVAMTLPKIGGGSRVSQLTFGDEWNAMTGNESSSLIGYKYTYRDGGLSSGVASYEPLLGGEENPMRSGSSYALSNNPSAYPPYDPIELIKEDPAGETFFPTGSVGYSKVVIESIHKAYARSAQSKMVQEFYTARDFPWISSFGPKAVSDVPDDNYPNPGIRDVLLSFLGYSESFSSSSNTYLTEQDFVIETNDMHGKPRANYNIRIMPKTGKEETVSLTEYHYHKSGYNRLSNSVDVLMHQNASYNGRCDAYEQHFPKDNIKPVKKTVGVDIDVVTDNREVVTTEERNFHKVGGGLKICIPFSIKPKFAVSDATHKHTDYYKSIVTTKVISRYGIISKVRNVKEGAETIVENKYYDGITGEPVVQTMKDRYGDPLYSTNVPAYWTKTDLEPSYLDYPFFGLGSDAVLPSSLTFAAASGGLLSGSGLVQSMFTTNDDLFHPGDELFVKSTTTNSGSQNWHRLYVVDVLVKKTSTATSDPLSFRFGNAGSSGVQFEVYVAPYRVSGTFGSTELSTTNHLTGIVSMVRYKSGRKNMLDLSAGRYLSQKDPFKVTDSIPFINSGDLYCKGASFLKPTIDAKASRYEGMNSVPTGTLGSLAYNPVSAGIINQPYVSATYELYGDRQDQSGSDMQRGNGILNNWYYWLPARYEPNSTFVPLKPLLANYNSTAYNTVAGGSGNAIWFTAAGVTKSIPGVGPVEDTSALSIYSSIYVEPTTKRVMHVTANGKFGQTWVEGFEDMQQLRKANSITDLVFSPFRNYMSSSTSNNYSVFNTSQSHSLTNFSGQFSLDNSRAHTGIYSMHTSTSTTVKVTPKKYTGTNKSYFYNLFDFNLDQTSNQKFTYEVWVNNGSSAPSVNSNSVTTSLTKVSTTIDGWSLYRAEVSVSDNALVTFTFPSGQYYDDLRVYPSSANVKAYVYHPFKTYLMATLDENNYATFYEYNNRNQLVRLKKETEKGVITTTENIKNMIMK